MGGRDEKRARALRILRVGSAGGQPLGVSTSIPKMGKGSESGGTTRNSAMVPEFTDFLPRDERIACYGIDCADILEWRMWTPGGEYTLNLNMKNVSTKPL